MTQGILANIKNRRGGTVKKVPPPSKNGFLMKKAREKRLLGSEWQKRYFQLEMGQLHFSDGKGQKNKLSDSIMLHGIPIAQSLDDPLIIEIHATPILYIKASSVAETQQWYKTLLEHQK